MQTKICQLTSFVVTCLYVKSIINILVTLKKLKYEILFEETRLIWGKILHKIFVSQEASYY